MGNMITEAGGDAKVIAGCSAGPSVLLEDRSTTSVTIECESLGNGYCSG